MNGVYLICSDHAPKRRGRAQGEADELLFDDAFEDDEEYGADIGEDQVDPELEDVC